MRAIILRATAMAFVAALAVAAFVLPDRALPAADPVQPLGPPPYAVCPLGEAAQRTTTLSLVGGGGGVAGITVFSAGEFVIDEETQVEDPVSTSVVLNDLTGLARAPVLVGLPSGEAVVETSLSAPGLAASACDAAPTGTVVLPGGITTQGDTLSLVLANPFAGSATVNVGAASEVGTESEPGLTGIIVPPRSEVAVDVSGLLPGRQTMSLSVTPVVGRVVASTLQEGSDDVATISGLLPVGDWYLPVPVVEGASRLLVIATSGTAEVPFQLDIYDEEGLFEAAYEDTVPARGQVTVEIADLFEGAGAVRVVAAGPVAAALRYEGEGMRAAIPGLTGPGPSWILPGAGRLADSSVVLFNPGEIDVRAEVLSGDGLQVLDTVTVPGASMTVVEVSPRNGVLIEADGDLVVNWITLTDAGMAGDAGRLIVP